MDTSEIVLSKPTKYKNISSSESKPVSIERKNKDDCTGKTCNDKCCFC